MNNLLNKFNSLPLWLKYGIYAVALQIIATLVLIPFGSYGSMIKIPYWIWPLYGPINLWDLLIPIFDTQSTFLGILLLIVFSTGTYFGIGALVGFIVNKIIHK